MSKDDFYEKHPIISLILCIFSLFIIMILCIIVSSLYVYSSDKYKQNIISFCENASKSALTMKQSKDIGITYNSQLNVIKAVLKNESESKISYYKHILDITYENKDSDNVKFGLIVKDMCLTENWEL